MNFKKILLCNYTNESNKKAHNLVFFGILIIFGFALYSWSLGGSFVMDDDHVIVHNSITKHLDLKSLFDYDRLRFLTNLTFSINFLFFGLNPVAYRLINFLIHAANAFLAFLLCRKLISAEKSGSSLRENRMIASMVTLLFLAHPLQTQSVNYLVQRSTLLCTFFYLSALISYFDLRMAPSFQKFVYLIMTALMAFYSKQTSITLLGAFILIEIFFFQLNKKIFYITTFLFVPIFVYLTSFNLSVLTNVVYARKPGLYVPPLDYLFTQFRVITTYLRLFILPIGQNLDHDFKISTTFFSRDVVMSFVILVLLVICGVGFRKKSKLISFGIFFFFLALLPESSFVPLPDVIFEHRVYLGLFGLSLALISGVVRFIQSVQSRLVILGMIVALFSGFTIHRNWVWGDSIRLMEDTVRKSPDKVRAHHNLGVTYMLAELNDRAVEQFQLALEKEPNYAEALQNLSQVYWAENDPVKAKELAERAIRLEPHFADPHVILGHFYFSQNDYEQAAREYQAAIDRNMNVSAAYNGLAQIYLERGDLQNAFQLAEWSNKIDSSNAVTQYMLGNLNFRIGNFRKAIQYYERAIQRNPKFFQAYHNLANAFFRFGNFERARVHFEKVVELQPEFETAYFNLANTYHALGNIAAAEKSLNRAYELAKKNQNENLKKKIENYFATQTSEAENVN